MRSLLRRPAARWVVAATVLVLAVAPAGASAAPAGTPHLPDLRTVIPASSFSVVQTSTGREFRYTHLVYDAGPGPLEIQPQYNPASGAYQGRQQVFTHDAAGQWSMVRDRMVPDAFVYHAEHGHFHFPLAAFGLYAVAADGGPGAAIAVSPKNGFCISDSYIYDSTVPHAGAFVGGQGSCADPTSLRGLSVGGADEYDYRDPGQSIPFEGVPDGTYWFKAISDPFNDFEEADETNNETDVKVTVAGGVVTAGEVRHPDTAPPPVTLDAPADGAMVSGAVRLAATTAAGRVEFIVDGTPVGATNVAPFALTWDSTSVVDGVHWVAVRATDALGRVNTSAVAAVTVHNAPLPPPGVLGVDTTAGADGRGAVTAAVTTSQPGEVLVAFVSSDGPAGTAHTTVVSGAGLTWSLVKRQNARPGDAEAWTAAAPTVLTGAAVTSTPSRPGYDQSLTVIAFANAAGVGSSGGASAANGPAAATVTTTRDGSWVFGAGNDYDTALSRVLGANQVIRRQWVDTATGDTFWSQSRTAVTPSAGTAVPLGTTAPTSGQWNLAAVEVLAAAATPPVDTTPPLVSVTDPSAGQTVSGVVALGATASDAVGVMSVQFSVDGTPVGPALTAPPYMTQWDTRTAAPGSHTVTAQARDAAGNVGTSARVTVTIDNSAPPPATLAVDAAQFVHGHGTLRTPAFTTPTAGDVLVAFVALDGPKAPRSQSATVTGGGLTWSLVKRSDTQSGVSEIWSASANGVVAGKVVTATPLAVGFDGLLHVMAFRNAKGVGIAGAAGGPSGPPDVYLPGIATGSWVFAVGNDWDRAVGRTPATGQSLRHQWVDSAVGDTFWVQATAAPNAAAGLVTIHDDAPTNDQWNYAAVEVVPRPGA